MAEQILAGIAQRLTGRCDLRASVLLDRGNKVSLAYAARLGALSEQTGIALRQVDYGQLDQVRADPAKAPVLFILPIPVSDNLDQLVQELGVARDAEGLHPVHAGELALGRPRICPPTASAAFRIAQELAGNLAGCDVTVVGASTIVGRPLALLLMAAGATVRVAQAATRDLIGVTRAADVVISAAGVPGLITADHVRSGAVVIDVGATWRDGALHGDVDAAGVSRIASVLTHVPDGVGPVTSACLLDNIARLAVGD